MIVENGAKQGARQGEWQGEWQGGEKLHQSSSKTIDSFLLRPGPNIILQNSHHHYTFILVIIMMLKCPKLLSSFFNI